MKQDVIFARSSKVYLFITLSLCIKKLEIDLKNTTLTLSVRKCWILNSVKTVKFSDISKIKYDYLSYWNMRGRNFSNKEEFIVSLILRNDEEIKLFSFVGNDRLGSQEASSREFVELISAFMGKELDIDSKLMADVRSNVDKVKCVSCGHFNTRSVCIVVK